MPLDRAIQKMLASAASNADGIVGDDWYFNPQFMDFVKLRVKEVTMDKPRVSWNTVGNDNIKIVEPAKGDAMSKRTEIKCRDLKDGTVEFVGYKNVMTLAEIDNEIGIEARTKLYAAGRCYYAIRPYEFRGTIGKLTITIWNKKESIHKEFHPGQKYSEVDWDFFIEFLIESGERYGEIKADLKASEVHTIVI